MNQEKRQDKGGDATKQQNPGKTPDAGHQQSQGTPHQGGKTPQSGGQSGSPGRQGGQNERSDPSPKGGGQQR